MNRRELLACSKATHEIRVLNSLNTCPPGCCFISSVRRLRRDSSHGVFPEAVAKRCTQSVGNGVGESGLHFEQDTEEAE